MSKQHNQIDKSDFIPLKFGVKYSPPMISIHNISFFINFLVLEYEKPSVRKKYHHKIKLRRFNGSSSTS